MMKLVNGLADGLKIVLWVALLFVGDAFAAQTIVVDPAATETATTVKTLEAAFAKLANSGDTILVRPGTYYLTQTLTNKVANLVFKSADATTGEIDRGSTVLDGSLCPGRAFYSSGKSKPTINGFTFRNFTQSGGTGGAVHLQSSGAFNVLNCAFNDNQADSNGGAVYSTLNNGGIISNCCFTGNSVVKTASGGVGGGALCSQQNSTSENDRITVYDTTFTGNSVTSAGQARGGAVYAVRCVYLIRCQFKDNWLSRTANGEIDGGTISAGYASRLEQCTVTANDTSSGGTPYGLILAFDGNAPHVIDRCVFGPISTTRGGYGLIYFPSGNSSSGTLIKSSVFTDLATPAPVFFINGTVSGKLSNTIVSAAGTGGFGLGKTGATWEYENCTFVTSTDGAAVSFDGTSAFVNCLSNGSAPVESETRTVTSSLFAGTTAGCGFINAKMGDYRLALNSRAVDAGVECAGQDDAVDAGGRTRVVGSAVDLGAYERQATDPDRCYVRVVSDASERTGEWSSAYTSIQEAVNAAEADDVILLKPGVYNVTDTIVVNPGFKLTIQSCRLPSGAYDVENTILDGGSSVRVMTVTGSAQNRVEICGLTIRNGNNTEGYGGGIGSQYATIRACRLLDNRAKSGAGNVYALVGTTIADSLLTGGSGTYGNSISVGGASVVVENSVVTGATTGFGGVFSNGYYTPEFNGCVFTNNTVAGIYVAHCRLRNCLFDSKPLNFSGNWTAENCTFAQGVQCRTDQGTSTYVVTNCLFAGTSPFTPQPGEKAVVTAVNCGFATLPTAGDHCQLQDCFRVDPKFVDAAAGDYRLQDFSKCRDRGLILDWMTAAAVDADGNPRRIDRATGLYSSSALPDVGCFENQTKWNPAGLLVIFR